MAQTAPTMVRAPVLVLGIGNTLLCDEGAGIHVVAAMRRLDVPADVELVDGATGGLDLVDVISGRRKLIVIDAARADHQPGTVFRLRPADLLPADASLVPQHEAGLLETLKATEQLGSPPAEVVIFGIQPKEIRWGLELSAELAAVVPRVVELVLAELKK